MKMIKKIIKKIPGIAMLVKYIKLKKEFVSDFNFFRKNYLHSKLTLNKSKYNILLIVHSLEKGMCSKNPRCFGKEKINDLINLLIKFEDTNDYSFVMGINALRSYCKFYKKHNWTNEEEYIVCLNYFTVILRACPPS